MVRLIVYNRVKQNKGPRIENQFNTYVQLFFFLHLLNRKVQLLLLLLFSQ